MPRTDAPGQAKWHTPVKPTVASLGAAQSGYLIEKAK
jgi:hypothetical protein